MIIAALILAAGSSGRMGAFKPLLPFGDRPMIARVIESIQFAGGFFSTLVITGHQCDKLCNAVAGYSVDTLHNADFAAGEMLSSVHLGLAHLQTRVDAVLLCLGDQPSVLPATIQSLTSAFRGNPAPLIIPTHNGQRGHPILVSASLIPEILALAPLQTLRDVVHRHLSSATQIPVADPAILADIDTPEDYALALRQWESRNSP